MLPDLEKRKAALSNEQRAELERRLQGKRGRTAAGIERVSRSRAIPLSHAQERIWLHEQLVPGSLVHNRPANIRLRGPLDVAALRKALQHIVGRHEVLRTRVLTENGRAWQVIAEPDALELSLLDVSNHADAENRAMQAAAEEFRQPFDLQAGPMLRAELVRISSDDHLLLLTFHHFVFDAWSQTILNRELAANYESFSTGQTPSCDDLPIQFADYASWEKQPDRLSRWEDDRSFWKQTLADPPVLQLPTDLPRGTAPTEEAGHADVRVRAALVSKLRELASNEQATLFATLLAGFTTLLHRYAQQDDLIIGCPTAGRARIETENLIGVFINFLPMRMKVSHGVSFRQLLRQTRDTTLDALKHQDVPFQRMVQDVLTSRDTSVHPLFQAMFIYESFPIEPRESANVTFEPEFVASGATLVDLSLELTEFRGEVTGSLCFSRELWEPETVAPMAGHLLTILEAAAADPDCPIGSLPMLTQRERHQLLVDWNDTTARFPRDKCLQDLFEAQVERTPDAVAVFADDGQLIYRELNERSNRLAHLLRSDGVGPESLVGLCLNRSIDLVASILGILKAGAAYVPLDPEYPPQRLEFVLEDSAVRTVVTTSTLLEKLPGTPRALCLDSAAATLATHWSDNPCPLANPENAAYVLYTSGSTGKPKGVIVEHRSVVNMLTSTADLMGVHAGQRLLGFASPTFDISVAEMFLPLCFGGATIMADRDIVFDGARLVQEVRKHKPNIIQATPGAWELLAGYEGWGDSELELITIGEALSISLAKRLLTRCGTLWNFYGPTETTVWSTVDRVASPSSSIGRPIGNTKVYVLDGNQCLAPIGVWGELCIGGEGLARGYLNRPELTLERFIASPFDRNSNSRIYRTGDRVRWRADGTLEFHSRLDNQVKVRGYRIELGEIEAALCKHKSVAQCAVVVREDRPDDKRLVAYWVSRDAVPDFELRDFIADQLPFYMVPSTFVRLEALPLTTSGKLDRKALPAPDTGRSDSDACYAAPQNSIETSLAAVWSECLNVDRIGVHDDFFALGGHSILAARVCVELEKRLGRRVPLALLFAAPNIHRLAKEIAQQPASQHAVAIVPLQPLGERSPLFLMPSLSGSPWSWKDLLDELDATHPVFAIGLAGQHPPWDEHASMSEIASYFVAAIREAQVKGPIHFMGHSFGGMLAYEVARQLHVAGIEVGRVLVVDTGPEQLGKNSLWASLRKLPRFAANVPRWSWQFAAKTTASRKASELHRAFRKWRRRIAAMVKGKPVIPSLDGAVDTRHIPDEFRKRMETNYNAFKSFVPGSYPGVVVLFRARMRPLLRGFTPDLNWGQIVSGEVQVIEIPGNHGTILEKPNITTLARRLRSILDGA